MIYFDLHNHSLHSRDAKDTFDAIILKGLYSKLDCIGISDHNYWITGRFEEELSELVALKKRYRPFINVLCGMEVSFINPDGIVPESLEGYDYCLLEYFRNANVPFEKVCEFADRFPCRVGIAHEDMFEYEAQFGVPALEMMAEHNIFWELNVNYDKIHGYREHAYCKEFTADREKQERIKQLGIELSVGFDTHDLADYDAARVRQMCEFIFENGFKIPEFVSKP